MLISLKHLANCLSLILPVEYRVAPDVLIRGVRMLSPDQADNDLLYIGSLSNLNDLEQIPQNLLIWGNSTSQTLYESSNLIYVNADGTEVINSVFATLDSIGKRDTCAARLLQAITYGANLQELIDLASELFLNPVLLVDNSYKHLCHSRHVEVNDPVWQEVVSQGYWSYDTVVEFKQEKIIEQVVTSPRPVLIDWGIGKKIRRISTKFEVDGMIVGHVAVLEYQKPFEGDEADLLDLLSRVIASELSKPGYAYLVKGMAYESIISDLLDGRIADPGTVLSRLRTFGWEVGSCLNVLLIDTEPYDPSHSLNKVLKNTVEKLLENARPVVYHNQLVVMMESEATASSDIKYLEKLKGFLQKENMCAGLSQQFNCLEDIREFFDQAQALLEVGKKIHPNEPLYTYDHYSVYLMIRACESHQDISVFCHPSLKILQEHDTKHNTDYLHTLHTFLIHARNTNVAAEALFIHRNTMSYRLSKIEKLTGLDFRDDALLSQLYLSFKILEYTRNL